MDKRKKWKCILALGALPFAAPVLLGLYDLLFDAGIGFPGAAGAGESFFEIIVLYSFLYWPTYLIGLGVMILAAVKLRK